MDSEKPIKDVKEEESDYSEEEEIVKKLSMERIEGMKINTVHKIMKENEVKIDEYTEDEDENEQIDLQNKYRLYNFISKKNLFYDEEEKSLFNEKSFKSLYFNTDSELKKLCKRNDVEKEDNRIDTIRKLIRMMKYVKIVSRIEPVTDKELQIVRLKDNRHKFYVCGTSTFKFKDRLKGLQATWDSVNKSWCFNKDRLDMFINFIVKNTAYDEVIDDTIPDELDVEKVDVLPPPERGTISVYQINNRIYLVGNTYNIRNILNPIGPSVYDKETKSVSFPGRFAQKVVEALDKYQSDKMAAETARREEEKERRESLKKPEELSEEDTSRIEKLMNRYLLGKRKSEERKELRALIKELKRKWDKYIIVEEVNSPTRHSNEKVKTNVNYVTYDGNICPPYTAMKLAANDWSYKDDITIERHSYKQYKVTVTIMEKDEQN